MEVMVYSESVKTFRELVSVGESLNADRVTGVFIGEEENAEEVRKYCDKLFFISSEDIGDYSPSEYSEAVYSAVKSSDPQILLVEGTAKGVPVASMVSVLVGEPCATEVMELSLSEGGLLVKRADLGGVAISEVKVGKKLFDKIASPKVVCIKPGFYPASDSERKGEMVRLKPEVKRRTEVVEIKRKERGEGFEDADVIVVAGRGVKKKEDLGMLEELAKLLGGVVGVTRPLSADLHWAPTWIGMSGIPVKPKLYVGVGVSGQIQHIAGIRNSKVIVAVNIDPNAPIFEHADYGIIGDLYQVVPKLIEILKE
jgi:electron transfer flavoprotein alpha subunit